MRTFVPRVGLTHEPGTPLAAFLLTDTILVFDNVRQTIIISHATGVETDVPALDLYRALRMVNPSPYNFYLRLGGKTLIGASPEELVKLEKGIASTCPIAGTRPHDVPREGPAGDARGRGYRRRLRPREGIPGDGQQVQGHLRRGPWKTILAGGTSCAKLAEALKVKPDVVDVSGSLESAYGVKSIVRLRQFMSLWNRR